MTSKKMPLKNDFDIPVMITRSTMSPPRQQLPQYTFKSWSRLLIPYDSMDDLQNPVFWRDVVMETIACMFVECCIIWVLSTLNPSFYTPSSTHVGIFAGFFIYTLIEGYGPISGAPLNPAGCWGFFLAGRMSAARSMSNIIIPLIMDLNGFMLIYKLYVLYRHYRMWLLDLAYR